MRVRAPKLLWRFMGTELARIVVLCTCVVVTIIAFAAAVRPLADGRVEPLDALKLMGLLAVPMLQFALPFAAGLASTLVHHRVAAENEAMAAMAGGVSHRTLLVPATAIGLLLTVAMGILTAVVIPDFFRKAELLLTRDATRFIVAPIQRGQSVRIGSMDVHAEDVIRLPLGGGDAPPGAFDHLVLRRVLAVKVGAPEQHLAADRLDMWLLEPMGDTGDEQGADALLHFTGATGYWPGSTIEQQTFTTARVHMASAFHDDPKFLRTSELARLRKDPDQMSSIAWRRKILAGHMAQRDELDDLRAQLHASGHATLVRGAESLILSGADLRPDPADPSWFVLVPPKANEPARVEARINGGRRLHEAASARLEFRGQAPSESDSVMLAPSQPAKDTPSVVLRVVLANVSTFDAQRNIQDVRSDQLVYAGFSTQADHAGLRGGQTSAELLRAVRDADPAAAPDAHVAKAADDLRARINELSREVLSKLHERAAYSVAGILMILCGAIIALKLRDALPLGVYLWSFFPALACVITISSGQRLTEKAGAAGLLLLWGGVAALGAYCLAAFAQLRKN